MLNFGTFRPSPKEGALRVDSNSLLRLYLLGGGLVFFIANEALLDIPKEAARLDLVDGRS